MEENELLTIKPFKSKIITRKSVTSTSIQHDCYQTRSNHKRNRFELYYDAPEKVDHVSHSSKWNDYTNLPKSIVDNGSFKREQDFVVNYVTVPSVSGLTCKKKITVRNLCIDSPRQTMSTCHPDQPESECDNCADDPSTGHIRARSSFVSCDCAECKCDPCYDPNCQNRDPIKTLYESDQCTYSNDHCELSKDPSKTENNCKCGKCSDPSELSCDEGKRKEDKFSNYVMGYVCIDCKFKRDPNAQREPSTSGTSSSKPCGSKESKGSTFETDSLSPCFVQQLEDSSTIIGVSATINNYSSKESKACTCQTDLSKPYFTQQIEEPTHSTVRSDCSKISKVSTCQTDPSKPIPIHHRLEEPKASTTVSSKPCPIHQVRPRNTTIITSISDVVKCKYSTESKVATSETNSSRQHHQVAEPVDIDITTMKSISGSIKYNYSKESKVASSDTNSLKPYKAPESKKPADSTTKKSVSEVTKCRCSKESKPDRGDGTCKCDKICFCKEGELDKDINKIKPITYYNILQAAEGLGKSCSPCSCPICKCETKGGDKGGGSGKKKSESCTCEKCNCSPCEDTPKPAEKPSAKDVTPCTCQDCKCDPCSDPTKAKGKGSAEPCTCDKCKCVPCSDPTKGAASGSGGGTCNCQSCKCDPCSDPSKKKDAGGKDECTCSDCTCKECAFKKEGGKSGVLMCDCKDCTCPVCTRKPEKSAKSDCSCSSCPNPECSSKGKEKSGTMDCNCAQCSCPVCTKKKDGGGGAKRPSSAKVAADPKACTCTKCSCPSCSKKTKGGGSGGESKLGCDCKNCTCPVCTKKGDKGDKAEKGGKDSKPICTCKECVCAACTAKKESKGGESGLLACNCKECTCPVCTKKADKDKPAGEAKLTCNCQDCTCPVCTAGGGKKKEASGGEKGALACNCKECSCPVCTKKGAKAGGEAKLTCNCKDCTCPVCKAGGGKKAASGGEAKLTCNCPDCTCPVCPAGGGKKKEASGGEAKLTCNCKDCTCPVCTAGGGKKASGGESGGLVTEATLKCNCENCKCPICTKKDGGGGGSKGAPCKCPSTAGGKKPSSSGSPKKPSNGGQRAAASPSKGCKCDEKKKDTVTCTCQTCTCSPCKAGGGKQSAAAGKPSSPSKGGRGSSAGKPKGGPCKCPSKTGGGGVETTATLMCNCNPCTCPVCTKKPAGGKKSGTTCKCPKKDADTGGGGGSFDFGGPTISCNCKECTCPVCTKKKQEDKKPEGGSGKPPPGRPCKCPPKKEEKQEDCFCKSCGCGPCPRKPGGKSGSAGSGGGTKRTVGTSPSSAPVDEPIHKKCACVGTEAHLAKTKRPNLIKIGTGGSSSKLTCKCLKCDCLDCMAKRAEKGVGNDLQGDIVACEKCSCPMDIQKPVGSTEKEFKSATCSCFDLGTETKLERGEVTVPQACGRCGCVNCKLDPSQIQMNPKVFICSLCTCSDQPTTLTKYAHTPSRHSSKSAQEYLTALSRLCSSHVQHVDLIEAPPCPATTFTSTVDCKQTESDKRFVCRCTAYCSLIKINAPSEKGDVAVCTSTILREIREIQCETNPVILREALVGDENATTPKDKSQNTEKTDDQLEQQPEHQPELIKNMIAEFNNKFQTKRQKQRRAKLGNLNLSDIPPFEPPRKLLCNSDTCSCIICASKRLAKNLEPLDKPTYHSILKIKSEWQKVLKSKATKTKFPNDYQRRIEHDFPRCKFRDYFNDPYFVKYVLKRPNLGSSSSQGSQDKSEEERIDKPLLVKKEDDFDLTMSNLMIAYECLEKKGKAKDQMIEGLSDILKSLGGENICESIMSCAPIGTAPDYDRCDDLRLLENCNFDYVSQDKNRASSHSASSRLRKSQAKLTQQVNSLARSSDDSLLKQLKQHKYQSSVKEMCESRSSDHFIGNFNEKMAYYSMYSRNGNAPKDHENTCRVVGDWKGGKQDNPTFLSPRVRPPRLPAPVHLDHQSESSIQLAINKLKKKCKEKDAFIKAAAFQLRKNISNRTLENLLKILPGAIGMSIFNTMGKDDKEIKHSKDGETQKKIAGSGKTFVNAHISLEGFEITSVIRITVDSLIIKWSLPKSKAICGYDIAINGKIKIKVMNGVRTCTMIHRVDLSKPVFIAVYAVTACGRCEPPATAIFELQTKCK